MYVFHPRRRTQPSPTPRASQLQSAPLLDSDVREEESDGKAALDQLGKAGEAAVSEPRGPAD